MYIILEERWLANLRHMAVSGALYKIIGNKKQNVKMK